MGFNPCDMEISGISSLGFEQFLNYKENYRTNNCDWQKLSDAI